MIIHIFLVVFVIITIELLVFSDFFKKFNHCLFLTKKIIKVVPSKKKSDSWKEKMLLNYSKQLILNSFKILGIFIFIILIYFLASQLNFSFSNYFLSIYGILETTLIVITYVLLRKFIYDKL